MKKTSIVLIALSLVLVTSFAFAQQTRRGGGTPATQPVFGAPLTFTGNVVSFTASVGTQHPALVVTDGTVQKSFVLGPYWFLAKSTFAAAAGDQVTIVSLSCTSCVNGEAVVSVANQTNGTSVILRDSNGLPLWLSGAGSGQGNVNGRGNGNGQGAGRVAGRGNGAGMGSGNCGVLPELARKATFEGTVASFTGGPGVGQPELILATAAGNQTLVPSPYRVILDAGYTFTTGAQLIVTAAPCTIDGVEEWVIITMKDVASGLELTFRDDTGAPLATTHGRRRTVRP